jgi:predicted small lipoprotein YifL
MRNTLFFIVAAALLAACGQRGPLSLPGEDREDVPPVASPIPRASPLPAQGTGATTDEDEAARRNRNN